MPITDRYAYHNISSSEENELVSGEGSLVGVNINSTGSAASVEVFDETSSGIGSGTAIAKLDTSENLGSYNFGVEFDTGLSYKALQNTSTSPMSVTVIYENDQGTVT